MQAPVQPTLDFWYEFGSNYSYLSVMRIEALAAARGVTVRWRPFLLGPIFREFGWATSPFVLQKEKGAYVWRDMARLCRKYDLPWRQPTVFPRSAVLPLRVALLGADQPWLGEFSRRVMQQNFVDDREIDTPDAVSDVLRALALPADTLLAEAQTIDNKTRLRRQTEEARALGLFGAPTFFVGNEMFWGNDRLDDALDLAAAGGE
ncbi:MAG TPA: 2-hydroxychromene-2-carboxylate isomerase [Accumulibacter sp.]|nr:2-hydroxychromene-2-carboxylate isomerase [Accumulibacter sp.]HMW16621.1 2-hydroxychromene-2-carboxylate isomerase [Accumulibacter sp.]HMX23604.1 2-hydroxychromene-2-carboxylate isomerase [Accumulibacter sp.]HMY05485.1 2-hydroxychromene-2-carboxylate isomerase [Accumulibacter sp.]HNC16689.1 2-hydroxychromene-2-carboxylate isomerase [Accumulibacter sp.]